MSFLARLRPRTRMVDRRAIGEDVDGDGRGWTSHPSDQAPSVGRRVLSIIMSGRRTFGHNCSIILLLIACQLHHHPVTHKRTPKVARNRNKFQAVEKY